jgi:hypothetical protein
MGIAVLLEEHDFTLLHCIKTFTMCSNQCWESGSGFNMIRIPLGATGSQIILRSFQTWIQIGIRVVAKSSDLRTLFLHLWMYCMPRSLKTADF